LRKSTLPSPILLDENIGCPLLRGEPFAAEFAFGCSLRCHDSSVAVNASSRVMRLHHHVCQSTGLNHAKELHPVNYGSIRVNNDPVVGEKLSDGFGIIFYNRLRELSFDALRLLLHRGAPDLA
jgi:hypothetical protein